MMESFASSEWGAVWLAMIPLVLSIWVVVAEVMGWVETASSISDATGHCSHGRGL